MISDNMVAVSNDRAKYLRVKAVVEDMFGSDEFIIHQNTLRLEQQLSPASGQYIFDAYQNSASDRRLEKKLNKNDIFFITDFGIAVYKAIPPANNTAANVDGNSLPFTYPDGTFFDGSAIGTGRIEQECLMTIWNGNMTLKTANTDRIQEQLLINNLCIPEYQYLVVGGKKTYPKFGPELPGRGYVALEPYPILDGGQTNNIVINLGVGDKSNIDGNTVGGSAVTTRNTLVVFLQGYKVANAAEKALRWRGAGA